MFFLAVCLQDGGDASTSYSLFKFLSYLWVNEGSNVAAVTEEELEISLQKKREWWVVFVRRHHNSRRVASN